ncbi:hypothetical protein VNI00_010081 [Paramarasmius palmivorus]|uniref:Uncharacterized protein n=1 Tax=Paramarasmius palmivorus TaxID=297713 RepID=A0AAW0CJA9_9AGAR
MNFQQPFQVPPFHHPFVQHPPFFQPARPVHYHPGHPQYPYGPGHWGHPQSPVTPHGPVRGPNGIITPGPTPPNLSPPVYTNGHSPGQNTRNLPADIPHLDVDVFWKQRLAPLPGFCSAPDLFKAKEPPRLSAPPQQHQQQQTTPSTRPQLMPPRSSISIATPSSSSNSVTSPKDEEPFEFDVHAEAYIPQWLKKIQNQPHSFTALPAIPVYPPSSYYKHFLPINLIENFEKTSIILSKPPPPEDACVLPIHENYHGHWLTLQSWELRKVAEEKTKVVLWKVQVSISSWKRESFSLSLSPGIRENYPSAGNGYHSLSSERW